jgi:hypothetical protein
LVLSSGDIMTVKIVIFLIFTSVTLVFNSIVIWFAYKAFANITTKVTETMREVHANDEARGWLRALESASVQAVTVTGYAKDSIVHFEPALARAQSKFGYGLAKIDVRLERIHDKVSHHAARTHDAIVRPAHRIGATLSGVHEVLNHLSGDLNEQIAADVASDASSTPTK